jgi:hypothetical protein
VFATALRLFAAHRDFAHLLADPVPADRFAEQPAAGVNHPAWVVGHLAFAADFGLTICGAAAVCPADWSAKFGIRSAPVPDPAAYPPKDELLAKFDESHQRLVEAVPHADPAALDRPQPLTFLGPHVATMGELLAHILTTHEAFHLGQLSAWRRVSGFGSARTEG